MRIFDPKNQFGSSLLSSADTQKSSVKLEKQMTVGGGAITLTSADVSDIENWELSNARVEVDGQMVSFLPDTSRGTNGDLTVDFGTYFPNAVLILKRTVFDGMKQEEEEITIEVEIQRLMEKTMAAATAPTPRTEEQIQENIDEWKAMGAKAYASDPVKYANATRDSLGGYEITGEGEVVVDDCFLSADTLSDPDAGGIVVADAVTGIKWHSDLPCFERATSDNCPPKKTIEFTGKIPNVIIAGGMFMGCTGLTSWTVALPNSITDASGMFQDCSSLTSFRSDMPTGLTEYADYMFYGCKLDITSVERISRTIANCTATEECYKTIHLGVSSECHGDTNYNTYINRMIDKGWIVVCDVNGSEHTHQHS